ncbi:uncharacterized protein LOC133494466 isoform X2 [Syngnathoides biaculeatus]|uniref:uncharacterized protein LOC133494466 isoform X2 n=1 Tax=Syngnathoides biaculeatus TaxID=300417 RepID=UPI002ADDC5EA|nr:uncharacterized protein LOC133494466 isoform X2 [Syngnathoides biaculeatus]
MFKLCALFLALFRAHADVLFASPGDNVSLPCFFAAGAKYVCWYKQVAGDVPQIVTSFYGYVQTSRGHRLAADVGRRMAVHPGENFLHLNISHVRLSDSAEYYCGQSVLNVMRFDRGIFLLVRESGRPTVLQRPTSIAVSTGGSADLKCTAHPGVSHVYWFWKASGDSHLLHVHTENNSGCAETTESVCVFTLSRRAVADAGTYYCAVASCGEIVFGKGTRLDVGGEKVHVYVASTYCLLASLLASVVLNIFLTRLLWKNGRRNRRLPSDGQRSQGRVPPEDDVDDEDEDAAAALPYVALDFKKRESNKRRLRSPEDAVYAGLRLQHVD